MKTPVIRGERTGVKSPLSEEREERAEEQEIRGEGIGDKNP